MTKIITAIVVAVWVITLAMYIGLQNDYRQLEAKGYSTYFNGVLHGRNECELRACYK